MDSRYLFKQFFYTDNTFTIKHIDKGSDGKSSDRRTALKMISFQGSSFVAVSNPLI
jgi:hypothetical protein